LPPEFKDFRKSRGDSSAPMLRNVPKRPAGFPERGFPVKAKVTQQVVIKRAKCLALTVKKHGGADAAKETCLGGGGAVECEAVHV
jgi:hypothetical protein